MNFQQYIDYIQEAIQSNDWITWLVALGTLVVCFSLLYVVQKILLKFMRKAADKSKNKIDDQLTYIIDGTGKIFLFTFSLYTASGVLTLSDEIRHIFQTIAVLGLLYQIGLWLNRFTHISLPVGSGKGQMETLQKVIQVIGWTIIILLALDNMNIKINTLVASLGITSIAIGLASQATLTDLISSILIALDKPFEEGDFIMTGDFMGTVENIGWKNTRIRALSGELLIFNNTSLQSGTIQNYQHMKRRRVVLKFGVIYETSAEKLERIPAIVREVINHLGDSITFDRAHFSTLADYSLDYEVVYYIESDDYVKFMDLQQAVNLGLFKRFEQEHIAFAYPTQAIYIESGQENSALSISSTPVNVSPK